MDSKVVTTPLKDGGAANNEAKRKAFSEMGGSSTRNQNLVEQPPSARSGRLSVICSQLCAVVIDVVTPLKESIFVNHSVTAYHCILYGYISFMCLETPLSRNETKNIFLMVR
jgi:hypothetical protein